MKKILFITICALFAFASCKKSSSEGPSNTITATIDGTDQTFSTSVSAQLGSSLHSNSVLELFASSGTDANAYILSIELNLNSTIAAGTTYTNAPNSTDGEVSVSYTKASSTITNIISYTSDPNGDYLTTVKITSLSNTNVQGTFSAKLVYTDGKTIKTVTNGKFNLTINR